MLVHGAQQYNNYANNKYIRMSRSTRQFASPKSPTPRQPSQLNMTPTLRTVESKNMQSLISISKRHYKANEMQKAIQSLKKCLYYDINSPQVNYMLGMAYLSQNQLSEALKMFSNVVKVDETYKQNIYLLMSIAHKKMGNMEDSMQNINAYVHSCHSVEGYFFRVKLLVQGGKYKQAVQDLDCILGKQCDHFQATFMKIYCLKKLQNYNQCNDLIKQALQNFKEGDQVLQLKLLQIKVAFLQGNYEQALQTFMKTQSQHSTININNYLLKGKINQKLNKSNEAIICFNEVLAKTSKQEVYCQTLGEVAVHFMKQRDFYEALNYLKRTTYSHISSKATDNLLKLAEGITFLMKKKHAQAVLLIGGCQLTAIPKEHLAFISNLYNNSLGFGYFSMGNHEQAVGFYKMIDLSEPQTDHNVTNYNINLCNGVLAYQKDNVQKAMSYFQESRKYMLRPEPYFYLAVILNKQNLSEPLNTENFIKILDIIEEGLKAGQNAHLYFYRSMIYLFLGMNIESLEDIDKAIQKSQDNIAKYFHIRGVIFMMDRNYEQAIVEFSTALSIDEQFEDSMREKCKCELLNGETQSAYCGLEGYSRKEEIADYFMMYSHNYREVADNSKNQGLASIANFMLGNFENAGPAGKLLMATLYNNNSEVLGLINEAIEISISIGCLQTQDLYFLKSYTHYKLGQFDSCTDCMVKLEEFIRDSKKKVESFSEDEEKRLLICKLNIILANFKAGKKQVCLELIEVLLQELCEGDIHDELKIFKQFLNGNIDELEIKILFDNELLSDLFPQQIHERLTYKFYIPYPQLKMTEIEDPSFEHFLVEFNLSDIENKPEAPWIRRGEFGINFTNDIQEYENLNLKTEENQIIKNKMAEELRLGSSVLNRLDKLVKKKEKEEQSRMQ